MVALGHLPSNGGTYESKKFAVDASAWAIYELTVNASEATLSQGAGKVTLPHAKTLRGPSRVRFGVAYTESQSNPS